MKCAARIHRLELARQQARQYIHAVIPHYERVARIAWVVHAGQQPDASSTAKTRATAVEKILARAAARMSLL